MSDKFPTPLQLAEIVRNDLGMRPKGSLLSSLRLGPMQNHGWRGDTLGPAMDIRAFDVTLDDGRIYRVRVSDITPEKEAT